MMKYLKQFSFLFLLTQAYFGLAQHTESTKLLERKVNLQAEDTRPLDRAATILSLARIRGGVEENTASCGNASQSFTPFQGDVEHALAAIRTVNNSYAWHDANGAVLVRAPNEAVSLLDTQITRFIFASNENPLVIEDRLFGLPEIRDRIKELGLMHRASEVGLAYAPTSKLNTPITLNKMPLRDVLMAISASHIHNLVWTYEQHSCNGKLYSNFNWRVR